MRPSPIMTVLVAKWWPQATDRGQHRVLWAEAEAGLAGHGRARSWLPPALWGSPGPPATVMAEMPMFLFTSLPLEHKHLRECILVLKKERLLRSLCVPESLFRGRRSLGPAELLSGPDRLPLCPDLPVTGHGAAGATHTAVLGFEGHPGTCVPLCHPRGLPRTEGPGPSSTSLPSNLPADAAPRLDFNVLPPLLYLHNNKSNK